MYAMNNQGITLLVLRGWTLHSMSVRRGIIRGTGVHSVHMGEQAHEHDIKNICWKQALEHNIKSICWMNVFFLNINCKPLHIHITGRSLHYQVEHHVRPKKSTFGNLHHQNGSIFLNFFFMSRYTWYPLHTKKSTQIWGFVFLIKHTVSN